jgi:hypothetical protein
VSTFDLGLANGKINFGQCLQRIPGDPHHKPTLESFIFMSDVFKTNDLCPDAGIHPKNGFV